MNKEEFKILSARDHIRLRMNMYVGSSSLENVDRFILGKYKTVQYVPAFIKIIEEILDNSLDEAIRTDFKYANKIDVTIKDDAIIISDNGRGIPQGIVTDVDGTELQRPVAAWTRVNAGTSFSDERVSIGANGVGSSCTNFLSKQFVGKTWQNGNMITVTCTDGCSDTKITNSKKDGNGTVVAFIPDFKMFEQDKVDQYDTIDIVKDRLLNMSIAFPKIKFTFNGKIIEGVNNFNSYADLFGIDGASRYVFTSENLSFFVTASEDGFRPNCYINGVNTRLGGSYVDLIVNGVVEELAAMIKRKYKVVANKSTIKNGMTFVMFAKNFINPKYDSQTKERMTNTVGQVKTHYTENCKYDFNYIAKKLMAFDDFIKPLVDAQIAKQEADEIRDAQLINKKQKKVKVAKHIPSSDMKNATLILTEGDSAGSGLISIRNEKDGAKFGYLPLRGVIRNVWLDSVKDTMSNQELLDFANVMGLDFTNPESYKNMNYKEIGVLVDQDLDGGKILCLIACLIFRYWPKIITELNALKVYRSPIIIATKGKSVKWFYNVEDADTIKQEGGWYIRYNKGVGSLELTELDSVINKPVCDIITISDKNYFELMFGKDSDARKEYMIA